MEARDNKLIILLLVAILASIWITSLWRPTETATTVAITITNTKTITTCPPLDWWETIGATENLQLYPDSYINTTSKQLTLHVKNTGSVVAVIYKIEVVALGSTDITETINPGEDKTITVRVAGAVPDTNYAVKIYTRAGNVYTITVQAR